MGHQVIERTDLSCLPLHSTNGRTNQCAEQSADPEPLTESWESNEATWRSQHAIHPAGEWFRPFSRVSPWSRSPAKRIFDCSCVLLGIPLALPLMLVIAVLVRLTSPGPALFLQKRMGRHGRTFTIFKFRTMVHDTAKNRHPITTSNDHGFTPIGAALRALKLDELPQVVNVLLGDMSLVGPRPKLPEHVIFDLPCRPGITGMATIAFANEEKVLSHIPGDRLNAYYHSMILPTKRRMDSDYMACATLISDLRILIRTLLRRWGNEAWTKPFMVAPFAHESRQAEQSQLSQFLFRTRRSAKSERVSAS